MLDGKKDGRSYRWDSVRGVMDASKPLKQRINVVVPLLDDEEEHLNNLVKLTGLRRYQIMRQALLSFTPEMVDMRGGYKANKREMAKFETLLALEIADGNRRVAGGLLGITASGVLGRIQKLGLKVKQNRAGRPTKSDLLKLRRVFNEQRAVRLFGRQQTGGGDSGAPGGGPPGVG